MGRTTCSRCRRGPLDGSAVFSRPDGQIYVTRRADRGRGGRERPSYDLATNSWSAGTDLPAAVYNHAAVVDSLGTHRRWPGGSNSAGAAVTTVTPRQQARRTRRPDARLHLNSGDPQIARHLLHLRRTCDREIPKRPTRSSGRFAPNGLTIDVHSGLISWQPVEGRVRRPVRGRFERKIALASSSNPSRSMYSPIRSHRPRRQV